MKILELDQSITETLFNVTQNNQFYQYLFLTLGAVFIYLIPVMLVIMFFWRRERTESVKIFVGTIFTWKILSNYIGEYIYNTYGFRDRPFADRGMVELFFEQPEKAFPSDHAAVLMVVTLLLFYYKKKGWAKAFLIGTIVSSLSRVFIGFHFAGDILGGWLVGVIGFVILVVLDKPLSVFINKIISLFSKKSDVIPIAD